MSQIKLKHSGGNSVIIAAPDSNPASDRTLKLPSNADGEILTDQSSLNAAKLTGNLPAGVGIGAMEKMVSVAVDSNITCDSSTGTVFILGNNSRFHSARGGIGTSFSSGFAIGNTSGIVTFPETGVYYLVLNIDCVVTFTNIRSPVAQIHVTTDGTNYNVASQKGVSINRPTGTTTSQQCSTEYIFDVTDTSTHKAKFGCSPDNIGTLFMQADSTMFLTGFHIFKMRNT